VGRASKGIERKEMAKNLKKHVFEVTHNQSLSPQTKNAKGFHFSRNNGVSTRWESAKCGAKESSPHTH
jgi:hypothetical protein